MESWGGYVDSFTRSNNAPLVNRELRPSSPSFITADSAFTSSQQVNSGQPPASIGFPASLGKQVPGDLIGDSLPFRIGGGRDVVDGIFFGDEDMSSRFSGSMMDQSPLIDLKLGRFADQRDGPGSGLPQGGPSKRCRAAGVRNQVAYCQVYGCSKDLSSSKDYHKRHKVCEVHSKTPKVIVGGIEQRFCQQCSRFHLLCEFDDGKRSCRKRLAGHNERRRKPQVGLQSSGRAGRFFLPYDVGKFHGMNDWLGNIKLEGRTHRSPLPSSSFLSQDVHPRIPFSSPSFEDSSTTANMFGNISLYTCPRPLLNRNTSLGSEEFSNVFNAESPIQGSGISEPVCALSLLSAQSQDSSSHISAIPMDQSLSQYSISQFSDNIVVNRGPGRFPDSVDGSQAGPGPVYDGDSSGFDLSDNILHGGGYSYRKDHLLDVEAPTMNLMRLSSELQRVEHERHYIKLENGPFCLS